MIKSRSLLFAFFCLLVAILLDTPFLLAILGLGLLPFDQYFLFCYLLHLGSLIIIFFVLPKGPGWLHRERLWAAPANLLLIFLPFVGTIIVVALYLCMRGRSYQKKSNTETVLGNLDQIKPEPSTLSKSQLLDSIDILNLAEILNGNDELLIRSALEKLAQLKSPEALNLIMQSRQHVSSEVRFYATSQLAKVKKEFEEDLAAAMLSYHQDAENYDNRLSLAKVYLQYAASALLSSELSANMRIKAIYHLDILSSNGPLIVQAYELLLDLYLANSDFAALEALATKLNNLENKNLNILSGLANYYFYTKKYGRLKQILNDLARQSVAANNSSWVPVLQWWGFSHA